MNVKNRMAPTAVYRLFDANDQLLYLGISSELTRRMRAHAKSKPWWADVAWDDVRWYPNRAAAECEEERAIAAEVPKYNVRHHPDEPHGGHGPRGHRLDEDLPPVRHLFAGDEIWEPALVNARAEKKTITEVITAALKRYNAAAERKRRQEQAAEEETS